MGVDISGWANSETVTTATSSAALSGASSDEPAPPGLYQLTASKTSLSTKSASLGGSGGVIMYPGAGQGFHHRGWDNSISEVPSTSANDAVSGSSASISDTPGFYNLQNSETAISETTATLDGNGGVFMYDIANGDGFHYDGWRNSVGVKTSPLSAKAIRGDGTAIDLMVDGVIEASDGLSAEDAEIIKSEIQFSEDIGAAIYADFDWQDSYTTDSWPVTVEKTVAIHSTDPEIWKGIEVDALGKECSVEVETGAVTTDSSTGLVLISAEVTYNCPTEVQPVVSVEATSAPKSDTEPNDSSDSSGSSDSESVGADPTNDADGSDSLIDGRPVGNTPYTRHESEALGTGLSGARCLPPGEETTSQLTAAYSPEPFEKIETDIIFDPSQIEVRDVHTDDSVFSDGSEGAESDYSHRMSVDSSSIDNSGGLVRLTASAGSSINMSRYADYEDRIMASLDVDAVGESGNTAEVEIETTFIGSDGTVIETLSGGTQYQITNGIGVQGASLSPGTTTETAVEGKIGEKVESFRQVFRLDTRVVDQLEVIGESNPSISYIPSKASSPDDEAPDQPKYAVVEGSFSTPQRMTDLFRFRWTSYSKSQLKSFAQNFDIPPTQTAIERVPKDDVGVLNATLSESSDSVSGSSTEPIYDRDLPHKPASAIPTPYLTADDGGEIAVGCNDDGRIRTASPPSLDTPDGIMYWPIVLDIVAELNDIYPSAVSREDVVAQAWSKTNPSIFAKMGTLRRVPSRSTMYVPLTIVIPRNEYTEASYVEDLGGGWHLFGQSIQTTDGTDERFVVASRASDGTLVFLSANGEPTTNRTNYRTEERLSGALSKYNDNVASGDIDSSLAPENKPEASAFATDAQQYPVHMDFTVWIGGERIDVASAFMAGGLHVGGSTSMGSHGPKLTGNSKFSLGFSDALGPGSNKGVGPFDG